MADCSNFRSIIPFYCPNCKKITYHLRTGDWRWLFCGTCHQKNENPEGK